MRIIGVLDLASGDAVHAVAGQRSEYQPVRQVAGSPIEPGDAVSLAHAYIDRLGLSELYVADLDAICGGPWQETLISRLARLGVPLWLDAGASSVQAAVESVGLGASRVVVGLETLTSFDALREISQEVGGDRVAFSLDLRNEVPVVAREAEGIRSEEAAEVLASRAVDAGARSLIVIDLGRVGTRTGPRVELIDRVRRVTPGVRLVAGGGVRGPDDLRLLSEIGCDAALVATALQANQLSPDDVRAAERLRPSFAFRTGYG